ncbi:ferredoxin [Mycobacterium triplex]|uniref:ferredoxin n=1 Tax=Mycobacterium triplex TaxID=47839 RepID=UPI000A020CF4|nr:ferredoxin [Mycobacterium triplex]
MTGGGGSAARARTARGERLSRVSIDSGKCQGHGRCVLIAPAYFDMDDAGFGVVLRDEVDAADKADVDEAVLSCPEHAVILE